ncbi:MAG: aminoglycoside phosphotransferase family protein [Cellulomonas sp.]|nr:aminoglycoside phosphotransferase family protein [Cellulomonas sp.]
MSADDASAPPLAFSGQRLGWADLPRAVRNRISSLAGARVTAESSANSGFSPGFAAILELTDGRGVFVKAVSPEQNPESPDLARAEIRVAAALPPQVPAPRLYWWHDDGEWVILGFEVAHGRPPEVPWRPDELKLVLDALIPLADTEPLPGHALPRTDVKLASDFTGWRRLQQRPADEIDALVARSGEVGAWAQANIDRLIRWEEDSLRVCTGRALVHGDLRADNAMIDPDHHRVTLIDWPHASIGAPWLDLAFMLPSVAMQGGGDPQAHFWSHPVSDGVPPQDLRAALAGLTGFLTASSVLPAPVGIPNLRRFQRAQASAALGWLRELA